MLIYILVQEIANILYIIVKNMPVVVRTVRCGAGDIQFIYLHRWVRTHYKHTNNNVYCLFDASNIRQIDLEYDHLLLKGKIM